MPRRISEASWELAKASLSMAGLRQILQANISVGAGDSTYTVQSENCRRVVAIHLGTGNGDIRFNLNAAASASTVPVIPARYFVVDVQSPRPATPTEPAKTGDVLHFFGTVAGPTTVYLVETD